MSARLSRPVLSLTGGIVLGVQSPGRLNAARSEVWHCVGGKWGSVFGFFSFLLQKRKQKELLQLGQTGRTAEASNPFALTHTPMHEPFWSEVVSTPLEQTFCSSSSPKTPLRKLVSLIVLNPKYLWHYVTPTRCSGSPDLLKFQIVCDEEGQKLLSPSRSLFLLVKLL